MCWLRARMSAGRAEKKAARSKREVPMLEGGHARPSWQHGKQEVPGSPGQVQVATERQKEKDERKMREEKASLMESFRAPTTLVDPS